MSTRNHPAPGPREDAAAPAALPPPATTRSKPVVVACLLAGGGILALLIAGVLVIARSAPPDAAAGRPQATPSWGVPTIVTGELAPDFGALDLAEQPVELSTLRGHPVWLHFGATWCSRCTAQLPLIAQKQQQYAGQGLAVVGVNVQESPAEVRAWLQGRFQWPFLADQSGKLAQLYNIALNDLPTHVFIDRAGMLRSRHGGELDAAQMDDQLRPILAAAEAPTATVGAGPP